MTIRYVATLTALVVLNACATSLTLPVVGQAVNGSETFSGTATGYVDGGGTIEIVSNQGRVCTGNFVYVTSRTGEGVISCSDGTSGPIEFVSTGQKGTGSGTIGGEQITFTFG